MNIGIVGSGKIVHTCLDALENIREINCTALCVRPQSTSKGKHLCTQFHIPKLYSDYDMMLKDDNIDFIYIGLINTLHFSFAKKALLAGKHVICEKPFTTTFNDLQDLASLAMENNLYLFEAISTLYMPNFCFLQENLNTLDDIKLVQCNFSQYSSRYEDYLSGDVHTVFSPHEFGGALSDINIYNLHFVIRLFGRPNDVQYFPNRGYNGVDTSGILILQYEHFMASCTGAKDSSSPSFCIIQGKNGYLRIEGPSNICEQLELNIENKPLFYNEQKEYSNRLVYEFKSFLQMVQNRDLDKCYEYLNHSLLVMEVLDKLMDEQ